MCNFEGEKKPVGATSDGEVLPAEALKELEPAAVVTEGANIVLNANKGNHK